MAIQFPNFLGHGEQTPDYSPISNLLGNILRGYQIVKSPAQMERQAQSEELANALKQLQLQHAPTKMSLEEELLRAQIEKAKKLSVRPSGDIANAMYIEQLRAYNPELAEKLSNVFQQKQEAEDRRLKNIERYSSALAWRTLPAIEKNRSLALAVGMGIDPVSASEYFASGKNLNDLANEQGYTLNEVNANYAPTTPNITAVQRRSAFDAEMKELNNKIKEAVSPYAKRFAGISFEQIADQLQALAPSATEKEKRKIGKFLAGRALLPELTALRINTMGGRVGIEAIRHLEDKSLANLKLIAPIDSEIYNYMQDYIQEYIEEAQKKYANVINNFANIKTPAPTTEEFDPSQKEESGTQVFNLATGQWE